MKKVIIAIIVIILVVIVMLIFLFWKGFQISKEKGLSVLTYEKEYQTGENPKVKITNNSPERICFSSCYPYYLEKNNGSPLKSYQYGNCPHPDVAEICMAPREVKLFEILLDNMTLEKGHHRVAIPACIRCALRENFRKDKFFYSNEFMIK